MNALTAVTELLVIPIFQFDRIGQVNCSQVRYRTQIGLYIAQCNYKTVI